MIAGDWIAHNIPAWQPDAKCNGAMERGLANSFALPLPKMFGD